MNSLYEPLMRDGLIEIAAHAFDPHTETCVKLREGRLCHRRLNDVLSDTENVRPGEAGISCFGLTTPAEVDQIQRARKLRAEAIARVLSELAPASNRGCPTGQRNEIRRPQAG
jgi:hypothetical protein